MKTPIWMYRVSNYKIIKNPDGSWSVRGMRGYRMPESSFPTLKDARDWCLGLK